jgi:[histone H3]-dimethyl/trimethyl-L-lysine36 demethylase
MRRAEPLTCVALHWIHPPPAGQASATPTPTGYLAQHALFDQIPALRNDILVPEYCALGDGEVSSTNAWFGPRGTVSPLHYDPQHNLLAQVVGAKYVRLYHPRYSKELCPYQEGLTTNTSQVDLDHPGPEQRGALRGVPFEECVLGAGQMLYIPPGWWHYVKALSTSFSVSFWWSYEDPDLT